MNQSAQNMTEISGDECVSSLASCCPCHPSLCRFAKMFACINAEAKLKLYSQHSFVSMIFASMVWNQKYFLALCLLSWLSIQRCSLVSSILHKWGEPQYPNLLIDQQAATDQSNSAFYDSHPLGYKAQPVHQLNITQSIFIFWPLFKTPEPASQ